MRIEVLMSTYNGEKYLCEQVESIMSQKNVKVHLTIRDDGSTDNTKSILKKFQNIYPNYIKVIYGKNIGYKKSFLILLDLAEDNADFYAFADQDDKWMSNKVIAGITQIAKKRDNIVLHVSSVSFCDENLNVNYVNYMDEKKQSLYSDFVRHSFPGCTMIFSKKLKELAQSTKAYEAEYTPSHDFVISSIAFAFGNVFVDHNSYTLHRRHAQSETSKGKGGINRLKTEYKILFKSKYQKNTMAIILNKISNNVDYNLPIYKDFIKLVIGSRKSKKDRIKLIFNFKFTCGIILCDIETRLKILLGRY